MDTNKTPPEGLAGKKKPRLTAMERLAIAGFTHLKKKMREGNGVWLEEIQRP
jgi:hypothetical protein